jgi:AcrR family transcriptional regulator
MATPPKGTDRRVQRTRELLRQAFMEIAREKGFAATTVQDITERANVNRGTFYAHFTDKYDMLDTFVREEFQRLVSELPPVSRWDRKTLHLLIRTVLGYFERKNRSHRMSQEISMLIERAIHEEMTDLILTWLKQSKNGEARWRVPEETIAHVISWAIFGAVIRWSRDMSMISTEQMADDVLLVIMEGVARMAPDALPD